MSIDHNNPTFQTFPYNNNRTAWRPIGFPTIMVVPRRRDVTGSPIANSQVFNVKILIESVPRAARVAGHDHIGMLSPDKELYAVNIDSLELADCIIDMIGIVFYRDGEIVTDPTNGDTFQYIARSGVVGTIEYLIGANYYDLSQFLVEVETLPSDNYSLLYQAEYFTRVVTEDTARDLLCIDASSTSLAILRIPIQHPGQIMDEFQRLTPPPYLTNASRAVDSTLALYRPLTDILQDVADEQLLLESINFVFDTPPEAIPYLSQLLGWELPYFPKSLDNLRRAVLRRTVEFQNLKGSRRAIIDIFRLFGFEILLSNLWWSSDGKILIRPDETLPAPYKDQAIIIEEKTQIDVVLSDWSQAQFGQFSIPLLFRPQINATIDDFAAVRDGGEVWLDVFLVNRDSNGYTELINISTELQADPTDSQDINIYSRMHDKTVVGHSLFIITGKAGEVTRSEPYFGIVPATSKSAKLDRDTNRLSLTLTGTIDGQAVFVFATYGRQALIVPDIIADLQSNRFDLTVITSDTQEFADPVVLEFAIEFLFKLKAFHSLLRVIYERVELTETYEVTDLCVGGNITQRYDTDIGNLQVPPAIIPDIPGTITDCTKLDPKALGYKDSDRLLRSRKLNNLVEELAAWAAYDNRLPIAGDTRLAPMQPVPGRTAFYYTRYGQDRIAHTYSASGGVTGAGSAEQNSWDAEYGPGPNSNQDDTCIAHLSPQDIAVNGEFNATGPDATTNCDSGDYGLFMREYRIVQPAWVTLDDKTDYCYKGRVEDELLYRLTQVSTESFQCHPCNLGLGSGAYYTLPTYSKKAAPGNRNRLPGSMSDKLRFTGQAPEEHILYYLTGLQGAYLTAPYNVPLAKQNNSLLGRLYQGYDTPSPETLHYTNRTTANADQRYQLALQRPSLNVEKETLHLPGCRFPCIGALKDDYTHPTYTARPWDDPYSTFCGPPGICGTTDPTMLNVHKVIGTDGNEYLVFDVVPYTVQKNGLTPDIPSLSDHTLPPTGQQGCSFPYGFEPDSVIHKIYSFGSTDSIYVELDQLCDYDITESPINVDQPIFSSYMECDSVGYMDFADGYGCVKGYQPYVPVAYQWGWFAPVPITPSTGYEDPLDYVCVADNTVPCILKTTMLDIPTGTPATYLILLSSGIQIATDLRLDCGCLLMDCESASDPIPDNLSHREDVLVVQPNTNPLVSYWRPGLVVQPNTNPLPELRLPCTIGPYYDQDGELDVYSDQMEIDRNMQLDEPFGTCSIRLDGTIPSLMETI